MHADNARAALKDARDLRDGVHARYLLHATTAAEPRGRGGCGCGSVFLCGFFTVPYGFTALACKFTALTGRFTALA
eukprot:4476-Pyramimonas_sp.AAC.1